MITYVRVTAVHSFAEPVSSFSTRLALAHVKKARLPTVSSVKMWMGRVPLIFFAEPAQISALP
jgi:hypothetical protein